MLYPEFLTKSFPTEDCSTSKFHWNWRDPLALIFREGKLQNTDCIMLLTVIFFILWSQHLPGRFLIVMEILLMWLAAELFNSFIQLVYCIIIYLSFLNSDWLLIREVQCFYWTQELLVRVEKFTVRMPMMKLNSFPAIAFELYSSMARALGLLSRGCEFASHHWHPHCKFLYCYHEFLCPVEPLYFSDEKSITVKKW